MTEVMTAAVVHDLGIRVLHGSGIGNITAGAGRMTILHPAGVSGAGLTAAEAFADPSTDPFSSRW